MVGMSYYIAWVCQWQQRLVVFSLIFRIFRMGKWLNVGVDILEPTVFFEWVKLGISIFICKYLPTDNKVFQKGNDTLFIFVKCRPLDILYLLYKLTMAGRY